MRVTVNGTPTDLDLDTSIDDLMTRLGCNRPGQAVAINWEVIPKAEWTSTTVQEGDRVEVVQAVGGG